MENQLREQLAEIEKRMRVKDIPELAKHYIAKYSIVVFP